MKRFLFIHPAGQAVALLFGIVNLVTGYSKRFYNRSIHINIGCLFYFLSTIGAIVGYTACRWAATQEVTFYNPYMHAIIAFISIVLYLIGAWTGFSSLQGNTSPRRIKQFHGMVNIAAVVLYGMQVTTGIILLYQLT